MPLGSSFLFRTSSTRAKWSSRFRWVPATPGAPTICETDRRIAEFKFIGWRGGPESIRQNNLFYDVFDLASAQTDKRKTLSVLGKEQPLRFLGNNRALASVFSKNAEISQRFRAAYGEQFHTVNAYWRSVIDLVEIVDLLDVVPAFTQT